MAAPAEITAPAATPAIPAPAATPAAPTADTAMPDANNEEAVSLEPETHHITTPDTNNDVLVSLEPDPNHDHMPDANNEVVIPFEPEPNHVPVPDANHEVVVHLEPEPNHVPVPDANHEVVVHFEPEPNHVPTPDANHEVVVHLEPESNHVPMPNANNEIVVHLEPEQHHVPMTEPKHEMVPMELQTNHVEVTNHEMVPVGTQLNHTEYITNEIVPMEQEANHVELVPVSTPGTYPNKRRKKKSIVWEHFTIETYEDNSRRACCKQCKQSFAYSTGNKVAGTSHLKRHIAKGTCPNMEKNRAGAFSAPSKVGGTKAGADTLRRRYSRAPTASPYLSFDPDRCRHEISRMIIMHDYPLHIVEHPGFVAFVQNLQPRFDMVSFNTVQGDCVATYLREKQSIQRVIESMPGRISLTLDMWSSCRSVGYVFLTGYFIDSDWKMHKKLLNVIMVPYPDSDLAFSHAVAACLSDWNMDGKLFSVTINQFLSDAAADNLRALLSVKNPLVLSGQLMVGNCLARSLSTIAQDALLSLHGMVKKVRDSVKYVKTSETVEEKFLELKQQLQVPSTKVLDLDDRSKWNTTYEMLLTASELKEVFSCLDTSDPDYKDAPSMEDWKNVETLCTYLKPLFETANLLTTPTVPTTNTFFHEAWKIQLELARAAANDDPFISCLTKSMQEKFDIYWKSCCFVLAIAVVMDPRFKMKLVEFSFSKIYGEQAANYVKVVDQGIHELFQEYVAHPLPPSPAYPEDAHNGNVKPEDPQGGSSNGLAGLADFDMYIMETTSQQSKTELDQYLEESLLPRVHEFDVVGWWKLNRMKYPTLSKMARDILSIPVCTVAADSVFDTIGKEMDRYKCSLRPETAEALICAKDWLQSESVDISSALVKMEVPI